ncbi:MAG: imidazolonepropionase [Myxococcaceae bacterium]|nr:imidazolonepropionase [Myxococcaceae bacterium]
MWSLLIRNTSLVHTLEAAKGLPRAVVGVESGRVTYLGPEDGIASGAVGPGTEVLDAHGGFVGPGFVDPHTHLVFAGDRAREFELRCQGASYLEIAQAGGGIANTVRAVRAASEDELVEAALPRLKRLLAHGVTCAEVKSGYGLTLDDELKMLRAIRRLSALQPVELVPTLLCAHAIPPEYRERRAEYVELCARDIIPAVAADRLARFCDVFVEEGAFTVEEGRRILEAARAHGMIPRLHADQLSRMGASALAAELGAASADHLEHVDAAGMKALASAGVSAVLVPTSTLFLRQTPPAPGRALVDAGVNVALGTNVNPGSAMSENLPLALGLACLLNGLTAFEAYRAATRGAALALKREDLGTLRVGGPADLVVFSCTSEAHLPYHLGINHASVVVKAGRVVHRATGTEAADCR